jgi:hypothetical protein
MARPCNGRRALLLGAAMGLAPAAWAQTLPTGPRLPPGVTPDSLRTMTPERARGQYDALDPETKKALRDAAVQAKAQYGNDPGLKETLKAWWKAWKGQ